MSAALVLKTLQIYVITSTGYIIQEINKILKFKKGVGITIKSKETSDNLAIQL